MEPLPPRALLAAICAWVTNPLIIDPAKTHDFSPKTSLPNTGIAYSSSIRILKVYYGKPSGLPDYCDSLGKTPQPYCNITEFFLEVVDEYETSNTVKVCCIVYHLNCFVVLCHATLHNSVHFYPALPPPHLFVRSNGQL